MIWTVILVTLSSVSAFIGGDLTPVIHAVRENGKQEARDLPQEDGGGKERSMNDSTRQLTIQVQSQHSTNEEKDPKAKNKFVQLDVYNNMDIATNHVQSNLHQTR